VSVLSLRPTEGEDTADEDEGEWELGLELAGLGWGPCAGAKTAAVGGTTTAASKMDEGVYNFDRRR